MEGLIPFLFKAIKRRRTRMCYRSLSTGAMRGFDMSDFHQAERLSLIIPSPSPSPPPPHRFDQSYNSYKEDRSRQRHHHQRHQSVDDGSRDRYCSPDGYERSRRLAKSSRFGSLRVLACAGGF